MTHPQRSMTLSGVVVGTLVGASFVAGTMVGDPRTATASQGAYPVVVNGRFQPPVVAIPKDGVAIIGASDDLYYLVQQDGTTAILTGLRREDQCWRRDDER
jgi:hypothetical protein